MDIKIWKDLLNLESDDYFIMIKNSIDEEFYLNDMKYLDKMYEISPFLPLPSAPVNAPFS